MYSFIMFNHDDITWTVEVGKPSTGVKYTGSKKNRRATPVSDSAITTSIVFNPKYGVYETYHTGKSIFAQGAMVGQQSVIVVR